MRLGRRRDCHFVNLPPQVSGWEIHGEGEGGYDNCMVGGNLGSLDSVDIIIHVGQ